MSADDRDAPLGHISKRRFLAGLGLSMGAATMAGLVGGAQAAEPGKRGSGAEVANAPERYDVIVMGAGTAGIPAAIFAAARGARVLLVEKSGQIGGGTRHSGGQLAAAGTRLQKSKGIEDTPDAFYADIMRLSYGDADPVLTRLYVDHAAALVDWLEEHGHRALPEHPVLGLQHEFFSAPRYIWAHGPGARYPGKPIVDAMLPELEKWQAAGKITVLLRTGVAELRRAPDGAVIGAVVEAEDGARTVYRARNVLLAAGGCGANPPLFEKLHGKPLYNRNDDTLNQGPYGFNLGEGIELGLSAGGVAHGGEHYTCRNGYVLADRNYPSPPTLTLQLDPGKRPPWEIQVNSLGQRFAREDEPSVNARDRALTGQPGMRAWLIFDQAIFDAAPPLSKRPNAEFAAFFDGHPMFSTAMSLEELAGRASLPEAALVETVARYNEGRANGADAFGRAHMPSPIAKPPFYAIETTGCTIPTYAGLKVDERLRVVTAAGKPIRGLYAAGDTLGYAAISGSGSVGGSGLTPALTFGRLLGMEFFEI